MSGRDLDVHGFGNTAIDPDSHRQLAVHCADRIAAQHPHPHDDDMPRLAGIAIAQNPAVRNDLRELLDAIGYPPTSKEQT